MYTFHVLVLEEPCAERHGHPRVQLGRIADVGPEPPDYLRVTVSAAGVLPEDRVMTFVAGAPTDGETINSQVSRFLGGAGLATGGHVRYI